MQPEEEKKSRFPYYDRFGNFIRNEADEQTYGVQQDAPKIDLLNKALKPKEEEPLPIEEPKTNVSKIGMEYIQRQQAIINDPNATAEQKRQAELDIGKYNVERIKAGGPQTLSVEREQEVAQQQAEAQKLAQQIGQYTPREVTPTDISEQEMVTAGLVSGIPNALKWIGGAIAGGAALGATYGAVGGTAAAPVAGTIAGGVGGAVVGGIIGLVGSLSSSMISNYKDQRRDMEENPRIVLQDGKTNLGRWATLAGADPSNRPYYVGQFNKQLSLVDEAYRQLKLDTSRDILKFEKSADLLSDFEFFYREGSEREQLMTEMRVALGSNPDPEYTYRMMALMNNEGQERGSL